MSAAQWDQIITPVKLQPCPCCGAAARKDITFEPETGTEFAVSCTDCGLSTRPEDEAAIAEKAWNRRQPAPPIAEMEGHFPMVLYFSAREDAEVCKQELRKLFAHPVDIQLP